MSSSSFLSSPSPLPWTDGYFMNVYAIRRWNSSLAYSRYTTPTATGAYKYSNLYIMCICVARAKIWILWRHTHVPYFPKAQIHLHSVESSGTNTKITRTTTNEDGSFVRVGMCVWVHCFFWYAAGYRLSASQNIHTKYAIILSYPLIQAVNSVPMYLMRDNETKSKYQKYLSSKTVAYTVVSRVAARKIHTHAYTNEIGRCLRRVARERCRETKLPPILFSKPIISSRASDFIRDSA